MEGPNTPSAAGRRPLIAGIVTETFPPEINGVAATVQRFAAGLTARGHKVHVVRPRQGRGDDGTAAPSIPSERVRGMALPGYRGLRFGLPAAGRLTRLWGESRPDILYVATEGPLGWSSIRWAQRHRIPTISGFHTNFHSYSSHYGLGPLRRPVLWYLRRLHNSSSCTLVPTAALRDELVDLRFTNVKVLGRGVDSRLFSPRHRSAALRKQWGADDEAPVAIYVGRLAPEKNLDLALEAFAAMRKADRRCRMIVVGDGPLYDRLRRRSSDAIFCGPKRGEELAAYYASADVFLFPSETETFGNVVIEALASGLSVLAFDYAAAGLLIEDGKNGWLVPPGQYAAFRDKAVQLVGGEMADVRHAARATALEHDWERVIDGLEKLLYEQCRRDGHGVGE